MEEIRAIKVSETLYQLNRPVVLEQNNKTRKVFYGQLGKATEGNWSVRGYFVIERKEGQAWKPLLPVEKISEIPAGEIRKLQLDSDQVRNLQIGLDALETVAKDLGASIRSRKYVVGRADEFVHVPERQTKQLIEQLISQNEGPSFWELLAKSQPDLATRLADSQIQHLRRDSLHIFEEKLLASTWNEPRWEQFFDENQWIFGYGLQYQFLSMIQRQANYGGVGLEGKGAQRGEFLMRTEAEHRFTVLVEIKKPDSRIISSSTSKPYRSGVPGFHTDFVNAVSQTQVNARTWTIEGSRRPQDYAALSKQSTHTTLPKTLLIYGHTREFTSVQGAAEGFDLFRSNLDNPKILTYDELFARAKFIVEHRAASGKRN